MALVKISQLPNTATISGTQQIPTNNGGVNEKITVDKLLAGYTITAGSILTQVTNYGSYTIGSSVSDMPINGQTWVGFACKYIGADSYYFQVASLTSLNATYYKIKVAGTWYDWKVFGKNYPVAGIDVYAQALVTKDGFFEVDNTSTNLPEASHNYVMQVQSFGTVMILTARDVGYTKIWSSTYNGSWGGWKLLSTSAANGGISYPNAAVCSGNASMAIGFASSASGDSDIALGYGANAGGTGQFNIALGRGAAAPYNESVAIGFGATAGGDNQIRIGTASETVICGDGTTPVLSDERKKDNIKPLDLGLNFIGQLNTIQYKLKDFEQEIVIEPEQKNEKGKVTKKAVIEKRQHTFKRTHWGLSYQQVKAVMDEMGIDAAILKDSKVNGGIDELFLVYGELFAPMIKSIQELNTKIEQQQTIIEKLTKKAGK